MDTHIYIYIYVYTDHMYPELETLFGPSQDDVSAGYIASAVTASAFCFRGAVFVAHGLRALR